MKIIRAKDYNDMSRKAANIISAQVILKPDSVLGLATGSSPIGIYEQLIKWYNKGDVDFGGCTTFNLDEYRGLTPDHDQSYHYFMHKNFFDAVNVPAERINLPDGAQLDLADRFLACDIQHIFGFADLAAELQQNCGFSDARLTADERHAADDNAAAQHPVKLRYAGQDAAFLFRSADIGQPPGRQRGDTLLPGRCCRFAAGKPRLGRFRNNILIHGIPASAAGAAAHPARAGFAAVGADVNSFELWFLHGALPAKTPLEKRRSISLFCFSLPHSVVCRNCSLTLPQQR